MSKPLKRKRTIIDYFSCQDIPTKTNTARTTRRTMASSEGKSATASAGTSSGNVPVLLESDTSDQEAAVGEEEEDQAVELKKDPRIPQKKPSKMSSNSQSWKYQYDPKSPPKVYPNYVDKWDQYHVRMPCSNQNEYPVNGKLRRRWDMIQEVLLGDIPGPYEFNEKVLSYNSRYMGKWEFSVLTSFVKDFIQKEERLAFFARGGTLSKIARLALQLPHLCPTPIPLLKEKTNLSLTLSQQQVGCLLANAFFCTFPRRNAKNKTSEFSKYPGINFNTLFMGPPTSIKFEKIKCLVNYFNRFFKETPTGTVTFTRQYIDKMPDWERDGKQLSALHVSSEGTIEDDGVGMLQVDFANQFLGGGVLGNGCVQEEIRFLICPEMLVTRLFTECLGRNECLIMTDAWGRIQCEVVAIDALVIHDHKSQFRLEMVKRELSKAYCGFLSPGPADRALPAVCTGNWGCGAFGGDKQLKALIQLMAGARAGRDLCYFTFDDLQLRDDLYEIHKYLTSENMLTIGDLVGQIVDYGKDCVAQIRHSSHNDQELFEFIKLGLVKRDYSQLSLDGNSNNVQLPQNTRHPNKPLSYPGSGSDQIGGHDQGQVQGRRHKNDGQVAGRRHGSTSSYRSQTKGQGSGHESFSGQGHRLGGNKNASYAETVTGKHKEQGQSPGKDRNDSVAGALDWGHTPDVGHTDTSTPHKQGESDKTLSQTI
ncbi:PARG-like protein [Mya arenaria]|uniref:poly(ADP-ribose) glycohydrolase n=1 Tax=Mya arenaria TaxID=6604 RepID=A0ABY7DIG4_MYAAR|nr:PARG-like protein [Mya arenaria]